MASASTATSSPQYHPPPPERVCTQWHSPLPSMCLPRPTTYNLSINHFESVLNIIKFLQGCNIKHNQCSKNMNMKSKLTLHSLVNESFVHVIPKNKNVFVIFLRNISTFSTYSTTSSPFQLLVDKLKSHPTFFVHYV